MDKFHMPVKLILRLYFKMRGRGRRAAVFSSFQSDKSPPYSKVTVLAQVCSGLCIGLIIQEYLWFVDLALGHLEV